MHPARAHRWAAAVPVAGVGAGAAAHTDPVVPWQSGRHEADSRAHTTPSAVPAVRSRTAAAAAAGRHWACSTPPAGQAARTAAAADGAPCTCDRHRQWGRTALAGELAPADGHSSRRDGNEPARAALVWHRAVLPAAPPAAAADGAAAADVVAACAARPPAAVVDTAQRVSPDTAGATSADALHIWPVQVCATL